MECFYVVTVLWVFSVCLHEFGHAWVAYKGGDFTVRDKGYLTFNPLKYAHPVYSLAMPVLFLILGGIGLPGGAVYINDNLLRSKAWRTWVSLAGPGANLGLIVLIGLAFKSGLVKQDPKNLLSVSLAFLVQLEISSVLLCLLPVPPLDGFRALAPWLPEHVSEKALEWSNVGMFVVFLALWYVQPLNDLFWNGVFLGTDLMGVDPRLGWIGYREFRFWDRI